MSDMEVDPHDWLKIKKSRDRAIRLRRATCQRTAWRKLLKEKEDNLRALSLTFREYLVERAILMCSKSMLVTMASVEGLVITAGVGAMLESGRLEESGVLKERGKVVKWSLETVTISAAEYLMQNILSMRERMRRKDTLWKEKKSMNICS